MQYAHHLTQAYRISPWRKQTMWLGSFLLALVSLALLASLYLSVTSRAATLGREIQYMQSDIEKIRRANADLTMQLAELTAADTLQERAGKLGLRPAAANQIQYVFVPGYTGRPPVALAPTPAPPPPTLVQPAFSESLLDWARQQFAALGWPQALSALPPAP